MSKNYDNWERLVTAVLRKERDKQTALNHSFSSTSSVLNHSFSSTIQFDNDQSHVFQERSQLLPMDYSDLKLDHDKWKAMLPPDKRELVWRSSSMSFFLDKRTGKNCFLLGATNLIMSSGDGNENCWESKPHTRSRFSEMAELRASRYLYIEGRIKTIMLSPETLYAVCLVFGLTETYEKIHSAVSIIRNFYDESSHSYPREKARIVHFQQGNGRADGWMEIEIGYFYVGQKEDGELQVQLLDTSGYKKSGLIVEGLEFQPLKGKRNTSFKVQDFL